MNKNPINIVIFIFIIYSCSTGNYDIKKYKQLAINPEYKTNVKNKISLKLVDTLNITTPNRAIRYFSNDIFNDSLFFGVVSSFGGKDINKIDVYDLKKEQFIKTIEIADFKIKKNIKNISVHSLDTIILTFYYPPELMIINDKGTVIKDIKLGDLKLTIDNPKYPKTDNYYVSMINNKPIIEDNKIYFIIEPMGVTDMPGFKKVERLAIYDLKKNQLTKAVCPAKGPIALEGVFYLSQ